MTAAAAAATPARPSWLKRAGAIGFWFFLIKGVAWMMAPLVFYHLF